MSEKTTTEAQNPLILRCQRLMEAFAKSDDEKDFYIDRKEGFLIYVDLDKSQMEIDTLEHELTVHHDRYCQIPKLSFYETKKIMEGFVNEKVYDIDTKEKLLDIIQSKEAKENFLEFIYDHLTEQEKWQQFYQERSRVRIIEWLRQNHFHFVFEEDLEMPKLLIEKLKQSLFQTKVGKEVIEARKILVAKAKTYYSNEALNPRPKRGRPPKQAVKLEIEPQITLDIYTTIPSSVAPFLFTPEIHPSSQLSVFSSKFGSEEDWLNARRLQGSDTEASLNQKLASLRALSNRWIENPSLNQQKKPSEDFSIDDDEDDDNWEENEFDLKNKPSNTQKAKTAIKTEDKKKALKGEKPSSQKKKENKIMATKKPLSSKAEQKATTIEKPAKPKIKRIMPRQPNKKNSK